MPKSQLFKLAIAWGTNVLGSQPEVTVTYRKLPGSKVGKPYSPQCWAQPTFSVIFGDVLNYLFGAQERLYCYKAG